MKITRIETFAKPNVGLLRLTDESGANGWGQIASYEAADIVAQCLHRQVAPVALGKEVEDHEEIIEAIARRNLKFPGSYVSRATAAVDTALYDLRAKARQMSVCELLGGKPDPIPVYGSSMSRAITPKDEAARLVRLRDEQGYRAFKVRVGSREGADSDAWPGRTEELIPTVRRALGDDIVIHADANSAYRPAKAVQIGTMLEEHGFGHFEEPCPYWEYEWTKTVTTTLRIAVAGGEQDNYLPAWRYMIRDHVVDIAQPDVCYVGGITRALQVARMAEEYGLQCTPHSANHSLVTLFTMHLMRAIPNAGPFLEFSIEDQSQYAPMYSPRLSVSEGKVAFPADGYGWGVTVSEDWLASSTRQVSEGS